jgi:AAA ATPase domain
MTLSPDEVFTPAAPVRDDMFATRRHEHLQDRLEAVLSQRGRQVVLYGPTGVGKTSLVRYLSSQRNVPMVRVECGPPFEDLMRDALGKIIGEEEIESQWARNSSSMPPARAASFGHGPRPIERSHAPKTWESDRRSHACAAPSTSPAHLHGAVTYWRNALSGSSEADVRQHSTRSRTRVMFLPSPLRRTTTAAMGSMPTLAHRAS